MTVKIRKELGIKVKPEAEEIDGKTYNFTVGWVMNDEDAYPTETAYIPRDPNYPDEAPIWIASGDLIIQQQGLTG
jgi:hypothetical protein